MKIIFNINIVYAQYKRGNNLKAQLIKRWYISETKLAIIPLCAHDYIL